MIGIVLVTHGNLAREIHRRLGTCRRSAAMCVGGLYRRRRRHGEAARRDPGQAPRPSTPATGVIVLTDMFGGTPSNLAISIMEQARIEVLAGVNLPMLVKLASVRTRPIAEAVRMAQEAGRKYITVPSGLLRR